MGAGIDYIRFAQIVGGGDYPHFHHQIRSVVRTSRVNYAVFLIQYAFRNNAQIFSHDERVLQHQRALGGFHWVLRSKFH